MATQKLEITTTEKNGRQFKGIKLKALELGNSVEFQKLHVAGNPIKSNTYKQANGDPAISYACTVSYEGQEVSFFLNNKREHEQFASTGGIGDTLRVTMTEETLVNQKTKGKSIWPRLKFELVE